jgi:glycosyltransferase involved in cell wall biosynthesis
MMKDRELIFISTALGMGGGEHFVVELLRELRTRGWSITLVCPAHAPLFTDDSLRALEARVGIDLSAKIRQPLRFAAALIRWVRLVRRRRAALIYGNGFEAMKWLAAAKRIHPAVTVCHLHDSVFGHYDTARARSFSRSIDRFFAVSEAMRTAFHQGARVSRERIAYIPNGVPLSRPAEGTTGSIRAELGISESAPVVVMVARTDALKGHEILLQAIPSVLSRHPNACFVFIGVEERSPLEKKLVAEWRRLVNESGIERSVRFEPYRRDARRFMRGASVVVVPSFAEGFVRTAIEAMAEGAAVIGSRIDGVAEILAGDNGLLVPAGDAPALASAVTRVLDDPALRHRLGQNAQKSAEQLYSTRMMVDRIEQELLRLLDSGETVAVRHS